MKLTKFLKLKRAIDSLDPHAIGKKLWQLDALLKKRGLRLDPSNTAITQEGIFYIEPETGIATKVIAYIADHPVVLTSAQVSARRVILHQVPMDIFEFAETWLCLILGPFAQQRDAQDALDLHWIGRRCLARKVCGLAVHACRD